MEPPKQLSNTTQKALIFNRGAPLNSEAIISAIGADHFGGSLSQNKMEQILRQWVGRELITKTMGNLFDSCMDDFTSILISEALNLTGVNRSRAAKLLGISKPTLHSKIEKYNIKLKTSVKEDLS